MFNYECEASVEVFPEGLGAGLLPNLSTFSLHFLFFFFPALSSHPRAHKPFKLTHSISCSLGLERGPGGRLEDVTAHHGEAAG